MGNSVFRVMVKNRFETRSYTVLIWSGHEINDVVIRNARITGDR